jgi:hypothetical protein
MVSAPVGMVYQQRIERASPHDGQSTPASGANELRNGHKLSV